MDRASAGTGKQRRPRNEHGVALIELAIFVPVLAFLTFGLIDMSRAFLLYNQAHNAAREAALFASTHPGQLHSVSGTVCQDPANAEWHGNNEDGTTFTYTFSSNVTTCVLDPAQLPAGSAVGQPLSVTARASMTPLTPFLQPIFGGQIAVSATVCVNIGAAAPSTTKCS